MSAIGGSLKSVSIDGRLFSVAADADATMNTGGGSSEYQANGDGTSRKVITAAGWSVSGVALAIDDSQGDLEYLQGVATQVEDAVIVFELVSGVDWRGKGGIADNVERSTQNATAPVTFAGPGKLERQ